MFSDVTYLGFMLEGHMKNGAKKTIGELITYCRGGYTPTQTKALVLELILLGVLELTPELKLKLAVRPESEKIVSP